MNEVKKKLEMASLLHDIGKFHLRAGKPKLEKYSEIPWDAHGRNGAHAKWSAEFISEYWDEDMADLALYHHMPSNSKNKKLVQMIQKADHHSSSERIEREEGEKGKVLESLLISVFSQIVLEPNEKIDDTYVPLRELRLNKFTKEGIKEDYFDYLKPISESKMSGWNLEPEYKSLWKKFLAEMSALYELKVHDDFNTVLALLKKYTSTMPSAAYVHKSDISLYDHSKTTAALATCRYLFDNDETSDSLTQTNTQKAYLVINGDISGIQNFIFKVSSPDDAQSGMSKRLRGRSLYLTLLNDAIASHIIGRLDLTQANILFCGGGRFTIIAPNTNHVKDEIKSIKKSINQDFIKEFNAELYFAVSYKECSGDELNEFGDVTRELSNSLNNDKKHKFLDNIEDLFKFDEEDTSSDLCSVCGKPYKKMHENDKTCKSCKHHEIIGQRVANADYMIKIYSKNLKRSSNLTVFESLGMGYSFEKDSKKLSRIISNLARQYDKIEVIKLNDTNFIDLASKIDTEILEKVSFSFSFLANVVPNLGKHANPKYLPLYFEHLASVSQGANKLGILKMDVDDLGRIFSEGFKHDDSKPSISRISTLSSQMDMFFSGFVNNIASNYKVYSKVDDDLKDKFVPIELKIQNDSEFEDLYTTDENFEVGYDDADLESKVSDSELNEELETADAKPIQHVTVYKKKYGKELSDSEKNALADYEIPTIHINYAGGDDLLVIGPYDDIICFANELRNIFKDWTSNNPSINLSAGINIVSPKFPIGKAAVKAEEFLKSSKSCGKNKITLFYETVDWNSAKGSRIKGFDDLFKFAIELEGYYKEGDNGVSKSFIYSLLHLWQYSFKGSFNLISDKDKWEVNNTRKLDTRSYVPLFKYKLRLIKGKNKEELKSNLNRKVLVLMPWIRIPVSWVSLRTR